MAIKDRKSRKQLGTRNHGRGKKGSRVSGRGGRGMAGSGKHRKTWIYVYDPEHFGIHGLGRGGLQKTDKTVNIGYLNEYALKAKVKDINAAELGFDKVLGGGRVTQALNVTAAKFSESAKAKIAEAGGKAVEKQGI